MTSQTYTRDQVAAWMLRRLGGLVSALGWTESTGQVQDALDAALSSLGASDFPEVVGNRVLQVARVKIWESLVEYLAITPDVDLPDNIRIRYRDIYNRAVQMLAHANAQARGIRQAPIEYSDDPMSRTL